MRRVTSTDDHRRQSIFQRTGSRLLPALLMGAFVCWTGSAAHAAIPLETVPTPPAASTSGIKPGWSVQAPQADASAGPLLAQAMNTFQTMTATRYDHKYTINPTAGIYYWDCIGFVNWALAQATPNAHAAFHTTMNVPKGSGHVGVWAQFLTGNPGPSWSVLNSVTQLSGGEVMIIPGEIVNGGKIVYGSAPGGVGYPGHATVVAGPALPLSDGSYAIFVYDSTALPGHGKWDSRYTDSRAQPLPGTDRKSGTGYGTMRVTVDANGAPTAVYWSASTKKPIAFQGQPVVPLFARPLN